MRKLIVISLLLFAASLAHADTYGTFTTKRFYSSNGHYFLEVTPNKRARLFAIGRRLERRWSRTLTELPAHVFLTDDGKRVITVDYYYGNGAEAGAKVVTFLDESGNQIATHSLADVANISRVLQTTSSAHWYFGSLFTADQATFVVETIVSACDPPKNIVQSQTEIDAFNCMKPQPYEELRFSLSGTLISRVNIQNKYTKRETSLLHDLELVEAEHPADELKLVGALVELAHFYGGQKQYAKARDLYERAIPIYSGALGVNSFLVSELIGDAANNYRQAGDHRHAERLFLRALTSLDPGQGNPDNVYPGAITVYENYAVLLRQLNRNSEGEEMERRAHVLRAAYPDYKAATR